MTRMTKFEHYMDNRVIQNLLVWFCLFIIFLFTIQSDNRVIASISGILLLAPSIYVQNLLILPKLAVSHFKAVFWLVINCLVFTFVSSYVLTLLLKSDSYTLRLFLNFLGVQLLALIFGATLKITRDSYERRQKNKEAELKLLKAQLNPHFLFNTLNNLYGLSVIKSDKLPGLMLKLSDLLRYSLYDTKETLVPLDKELTYLSNYISLEKIRLEDRTKIRFDINGSTSDKQFAPMLLIVFVENAFKHLGHKNGEEEVLVCIDVLGDELAFSCSNTYAKDNPVGVPLEKGKSGIGLANAKKRLRFLYPEKHQLSIIKDASHFNVDLKINLA